MALAASFAFKGVAHGKVGKQYLKPEVLEDYPLPQSVGRGSRKKSLGDQTKPDDHMLFLTFDDGPLFCTSQIIEQLAKSGHRATFFVIGRNLENLKLRKLAIKAIQDGHDLGNHSYEHPKFSSISSRRVAQEIAVTHALIQEVVAEAGGDPKRQNLFFRFPYGVAGSPANYATAQQVLWELNYKIAWWDIDTKDWRMEAAGSRRPPSRVVASLNAAQPLDVVLLHDRNKTAEYLPEMLDVLAYQNLVSVPLSDIKFGSQPANPLKHDLLPGHQDGHGPSHLEPLMDEVMGELRPKSKRPGKSPVK